VGALAAFLTPQGEARAEVVERMLEASPHRGTTTEVFVHRRCILGCAVAAGFDDASVAEVGRFAAAFCGSLDNLEDLVSELSRAGFALTERSPSAVVAAGFEVWGIRVAERIRGPFTAAISDGNQLFCFRDALGFGPLFYRGDTGGFFVATEAKQVVAGAEIPREPNLEVLERTFFETYDEETPSALRGVQRLPKGTVLATDGDAIALTRYWHPESFLETAQYSADELQGRFTELMDQAVTRCLTGNDALLLSGGVDSPAVAAFGAPRHRELFGEPLAAISAVYPRFSSVDERPYIELVTQRLEMPLHTWEPHTNALEDLEEWVVLGDGPVVAGSLALYKDAYRVARESGHLAILTGEFAEFVCTLNGFLLDHLLSHGRFRAARRQLGMERSHGASWVALAREVAAAVSPSSVRAARVRQTAAGVPSWIDRRKANAGAARSIVGPRNRWVKLQVSPFYGAGASVETEAICQEVSGVRVRRPFADLDLWQFFLSLPAETKFPDYAAKELLRRLLRGRVPDAILDRRDKTVFDDAMLADTDFAALRRLLVNPDHRLEGVDYEALAERLRREDIAILDYIWLMRLAAVHAFLTHGAAAPPSRALRV
jgi:asparagine synthase (glutamine-hydrolysing)